LRRKPETLGHIIMPTIIRNVLSIFAGTFVAIILIALVQTVAHTLYPPPPGTDFNDKESLAQIMMQAPLGALLLVILSYAVGTFVGSALAARLSAPEGPIRQGLFVGALMLIAGVMNLKAIPHPLWFWIACIAVFIWTGWFGAQTGCALRPKAK
jgi:hypothetical protein